MFGINDPQIILGYVLALVFAAACIVYGAMNWHNGDDESGG